MAYTTTGNIAARLGASLTTEQSEYFTNVLSGSIDAYINQQTQTMFGSQDETEVYVSGSDSNMLIIPTMFAITALHRIDGADEEAVPVDDYMTFPRGDVNKYAIRTLNGTWSEGFENYKVTGKLGYASVPDDIVAVATELAVNGIDANVNNYKSERVGDWSVTYGEMERSLSPDSVGVLASYRRLSRSI